MMNQLKRKRLYKEAFALLERAQKLLLEARTKHEISMASKTKQAA